MRRPLRSKRAMISPREAAGEGVGLYEDQSSVHGFLCVGLEGAAAEEGSVVLRSSGACARRGGGARGAAGPCGRAPPAPRRTRPRPRPARLSVLGATCTSSSVTCSPAQPRRDGAGARRGQAGHVGLAVGADRPRLVQRARAADAALLELAQTAGAADEVALDAVVAVRAQRLVELAQAGLGGLRLELALAHVLEVLGRAQDHVDDRADEREQRRHRRTADQHRIVDPPARVGVCPVDQREVQDGDEQDQQIHGQIQAAAFDSEICER